MNKMIWNTMLPWLIALGALGTIFLVALISTQDKFGVFIIVWFSAIFIPFIPVVITGIKAAKGTGHLLTGLILAVVFGLLLSTVDNGFDSYSISIQTIVIILLPACIYFLSFGVEYFHIVITKSQYSQLSGVITVIAVVLCALGIYLMGAWQSKTAFGFLPQELFFTRTTNDITDTWTSAAEDKTGKSRLGIAGEDTPFTGVITSYQEKLWIDPSRPKAGGITYFINGLEFGTSGDVEMASPYNSWHGTYSYYDKWNLLDPQLVDTEYQMMLHKNYEEFVKRQFPLENIIYYSEITKEESNPYNPYPVPAVTIVYAYSDSLVRKEITFYGNGVIERIDSFTMKDGEWKQGVYETDNNQEVLGNDSIFIDSLGHRKYLSFEDYDKTPWSKEDFVLSKFSTYNYLKALQPTPEQDFKNIDKMIYVPYPHDWDLDYRFDNLTHSYNIKTDIVFAYIRESNGGNFKSLSTEEGVALVSLISDSPITLNVLDTYWDTSDFQAEAVRFLIESNDEKNQLYLHYKDGLLLVENGPYYIDFTRTISGEPFSQARWAAIEQLFTLIEKYTGEQPFMIQDDTDKYDVRIKGRGEISG